MSVQPTVPFYSVREITVATLDGYSYRFEPNTPIQVANTREVVKALKANGCIPYDENATDGNGSNLKLTTVQDSTEAAFEARKVMILDAIEKLIEADDKTAFTNTGAPQVKAIMALTGIEVLKNQERDAMWKLYRAERM